MTASRREPTSSSTCTFTRGKLARVAAGLDHGTVSFVRRKPWGLARVAAGCGVATLLDGRQIRLDRDEPHQPIGLAAASARLHAYLLDAVATNGYRTAPPARSSCGAGATAP